MYLDKQLLLAEDVSCASGHDTTDSPVVSTNSIDLEETPPRQIGDGEVVKVMIQITATLVGATATLNWELVESAATALTSPTVLTETGLVAVADCVAGARFTMMVPVSRLKLRHLGVQLNIATANLTAGAYTYGIVMDEQTAESDWSAVTGRIALS
jgi:hypothetical protein